MGRRTRSGGQDRSGSYSHRLAPGEPRTRKEAADDETANEVAEKAGACPECDTEVSPEDVHMTVDNAL